LLKTKQLCFLTLYMINWMKIWV